MLFLYYPLLLLLESHQVCEELLFNELYHCTQNPLEIIEQPLMYWRGNPVLLCIHSICSKSLVALFIEPAGEYILICGWTGWPVHGLFWLGYLCSLVCPGSPSSSVCPGCHSSHMCTRSPSSPMCPGSLSSPVCPAAISPTDMWRSVCKDYLILLWWICGDLSVKCRFSSIKFSFCSWSL